MKKIWLGLLFVLLVGCVQSQPPAAAENIAWLRDFSEAKALATAQNKPILIDFYTDWCGWCKRLDKETYGNKDVAEFSRQFVCLKINAEQNQALVEQYKVRGFPTTVFLKSDGTLIETVPGYFPADQFLELLKRIKAKL